jgi:malate synthase
MVPVQQEEVQITRPLSKAQSEILTEEAVGFLIKLARRFEGTRQQLLEKRRVRQQEIDAGKLPAFLRETASIREAEWTVAPIPRDLLDRRVESEKPAEGFRIAPPAAGMEIEFSLLTSQSLADRPMIHTKSTLGVGKRLRSIKVLPAGLADIEGTQATLLGELPHTIGQRAIAILDDGLESVKK